MEAGFNVALQFTPAAEAVVKELLHSIATAPYLRVGVKGGGCSGMGYMIGFDQKAADDIEMEIAGIPVIMKKAHTMYLAGMEIDYRQQDESSGFVFTAPQ
ncbi:iron-sulfur cluster assembly accessory protein [Chitinophaga sp. CB10]|uniref:HesB/IscA family protein n=1 Tax=Chitinophaga sp. CB10 TaxID=1891659 RepID=UPI0025BD3FEC|nr:iron-sulfur cluster assembly accessory protein [Chitinophaga sp. CB10]